MKNKMTISDLKQYVVTEATKLYKTEILKEEKALIEIKLSVLNECVPPIYDKNGNPDYIAGAPLMSPETIAKIRSEMLRKATGWSIPEALNMLSEKKNNPWAICRGQQNKVGKDKMTDAEVESCILKKKEDFGIKKEGKLNEWPEEVEKGRFTKYCKRNGHPGGASIECAKEAMDSDDASVRGMATFYMNTVKPKGKDISDI